MYRRLPTKALPRTLPNQAVVMSKSSSSLPSLSKRKIVSPLTGKNSFAAWWKAIACILSGMNSNVSKKKRPVPLGSGFGVNEPSLRPAEPWQHYHVAAVVAEAGHPLTCSNKKPSSNEFSTAAMRVTSFKIDGGGQQKASSRTET